MARTDLSPASAEFGDIQGLVHSGYSTLPEAAFLLLQIADRTAARAWLRAVPVTSAAQRDVSTVLQIAFTVEGLRRLGLPEFVIGGFSAEFRGGIVGDAARSRRLGDTGANAPSHWHWGADPVPDMIVLLYAQRDLATFRAKVTEGLFQRGFRLLDELPTSDMKEKEPFGFTDGVSQPELDWHGDRTPGTNTDLDYGNLISAGEVLLGYRNEYGLYTDRPLVDAASPSALDLPLAHGNTSHRDLGRNGTYLVLRELRQDVRGFWRFVASRSKPGAEMELAEAMVGRHRSGDPLLQGDQRIRGVEETEAAMGLNGFTYDSDPAGLRCPLGAHVRRVNPRTGDLPGGRQNLLSQALRTLNLFGSDLQKDQIASARFHRLLRRGREFGTYLPPERAMLPDAPDPAAGLQFICLNANISRQFEFVQNAWLMSAKFGGLSGESDPLLGNREELPPGQATRGFSRPGFEGVTERIEGLPQFVTVAGGGYFFLPGIRALRYFASIGNAV